MRGTAPLLGVLKAPAIPPTSRVPHLAAHILSRESRGLPKTDHCNRLQLRHGRPFTSASRSQLEASFPRRSSPVLLAGAFDENFNTPHSIEKEDGVEGYKEGEDIAIPKHASQETPYAQSKAHDATPALARMRELLEQRHPEVIRFALRDNTFARDFIRTADDATFTEAVQYLDAETLFGEYKLVHRNITPSLTTQPSYRSIRRIEERLDDFAGDLDRIYQLRRSDGHKISRDACKVFLRATAFMGDARRAMHVFDVIMPEDGVEPDRECFNLLMEALCWNHAYSQAERRDLRVTESRLHIRRAGNRTPPLRFSGHKVDLKSDEGRDLKLGLRVKILTIFRKLVAAGVQGDEATFTNVMVAMGREGDLFGVKSILKSVWNVDVDMLSAYDEEEIEGPTFYEESSTLRPSSRLLFTIAHVFGSNNQVAVAFSLLDYVSRNYNLPITPVVWFELSVWTKIMSCYRSQAQKRKGEAEGQVDWRVFERLWQVMTDEPHNLVPDVSFLSLRNANFRRARRLDEAVESLRDMRTGLVQTKEKAVRLFWEMMSVIQNSREHEVRRPLLAEFLDKRHEFIIASQEYYRDLQLLTVATRRILTDRVWAGSGKEYEWATRRLPTLLAEFSLGAPDRLNYQTPTGFISLDVKSDRVNALHNSNVMPGSGFHHDATWLGIMRKLLDDDDHELVWWRTQAMLPGGSVRTALEGDNEENMRQAVLVGLGQSLERHRMLAIMGSLPVDRPAS
jgi:hypothetical protein